TEVYVSFGPVQSFISQARTTHDLWTGSYLLSILGREAIRSVLENHPDTKVIRPYLDSETPDHQIALRRVEGIDKRVGTVPNLIEFDANGNPSAIAESAVDGWTTMWNNICKEARTRVESVTSSSSQDAFMPIWERQVNSLWDSYWVIGEYTGLTRRKAIRNFSEDAEHGRKCTICGNREILRPKSTDFDDIKSFWDKLAKNLSGAQIQEEGSERLCGVCLTKRMCPGILHDLVGSNKSPFPSTVSFATLPWRLAIVKSDDANLKNLTKKYLSELKDAGLFQLEGLWKPNDTKKNKRDDYHPLLNYDGDYFLPEQVQPEHLDLPERVCDTLGSTLKSLRQKSEQLGIPNPTPYYAVLSMDGDSIGETLSNNPGSKKCLSKHMSEFAKRAVEIVEDEWGRLIYAGGDDVLAFLPTHTALQTAYQIREAFMEAMDKTGIDNPPTISAGIVFAHYSAPMSSVVSRSHSLLEHVAKEHIAPKNVVSQGRIKKDAFAIETWDRGGTNLHVVKKWESSGRKELRTWTEVLGDVGSRFTKNADVPLTSSFIHSAAESIRKMEWEYDDADTVEELFLVNYLRSRDEKISKLKKDPDGREKAAALISKLVDLTLCWDGDDCTYNPDHLLFAQFLSRGGVY
ncbi:MAG: type III-B CRISPR-associated protein Cas10/Cmr2, partial [Candidatus Lokiarchaeota archaeon]|nr:type III-B CRISPR-associated protein Cas10/Cmr2 [Candidatus Lokiarchaeota archaeon]